MEFKQIINRVEQGGLSGDEIASYRNFCAVWLYRFYEEVGNLSAKAAVWMTANRENYKSQAECERAWDATEEGQTLTRKKNTIKGLEHIQEVLTSQHFMLTKELKNT
ncbi:hypothetical protein C4568_03620 [Candidatus Parcubacteria bacterium]|nr:MAG: hypothetical protein C4568_03620 [Candidatus Parcubacteria bacterium]